MGDRVFLSLWLKRWDTPSVLQAFEKTLELFPYSRTMPGTRALRIQPVDWAEPPAADDEFEEGITPMQTLEACREFAHPDCAYQATVFWDIGAHPQAVTMIAYAPDFQGRDEERGHIEIELGADTVFLEARENATQIVFLVRQLEKALKLERRLLWTESGENFADRLVMAFAGGSGSIQ